MKSLLLSLTLLFSLHAIAQAPTVTSVSPTSGPSAGGTEVTITGTNLLTKVQCIIPCPARVTFGDVTVDVKSEADKRLVVDTPPHAPGTVDLIVQVSAEEPVRITNGFTYLADHDDDYVEVLLPIYLDGSVKGAYGSEWNTDFWLRNQATDKTLTIAPWPCPENSVCPPVYPLTTTLAPGATLHDLPANFRPPNNNPSRVLYLNNGDIAAMSLRVADLSRDTQNAGTDLPLIRENQTHSGVMSLFNVPMNTNFRVLLRVYDLAHTSTTFAVRLYDQSVLTGGQLPVHQTTVAASTSQSGDFRTEAAYGELDITALLPLKQSWPAAVRIEVEPLDAGSRAWAFASITSNSTQLVTLSTPQ